MKNYISIRGAFVNDVGDIQHGSQDFKKGVTKQIIVVVSDKMFETSQLWAFQQGGSYLSPTPTSEH